MKFTAGILAIGDEVVQGQITNRNASWLSVELLKINIKPKYHLSCLDQKKDIADSLNYLSERCDLILVSGGLGPTKDDCTRQSLAYWLNRELEFNQDQWNKIKNKLESRQLTIREGHKNQAFAPKGAVALNNEPGVAPGFFIQGQKNFLASLPGPPNELQPMFNNELLPLIKTHMPSEADLKLYSWICLGAPESEIAHIADSLLESDPAIELSYRLHRPYVEVKAWGPQQLSEQQKKRFTLFEEKIKTWFVSYTIPGIRKNFHEKLQQYDGVYVVDHLTDGLLLEKLKEDYKSDNIRYQCFENKAFRHFSVDEVQQIYQHMKSSDEQLFIFLFPHSDTSALVFFNDQYKLVEIPRKFPVKSKLGQHYAIEYIFLMGNEIL